MPQGARALCCQGGNIESPVMALGEIPMHTTRGRLTGYTGRGQSAGRQVGASRMTRTRVSDQSVRRVLDSSFLRFRAHGCLRVKYFKSGGG